MGILVIKMIEQLIMHFLQCLISKLIFNKIHKFSNLLNALILLFKYKLLVLS